MGYALGIVILLSNLMFTIVRPMHVLSALVVHITKHGYMNGVDQLQSMRPCLWSL